jgi:hypothetical protein
MVEAVQWVASGQIGAVPFFGRADDSDAMLHQWEARRRAQWQIAADAALMSTNLILVFGNTEATKP